MAARHDPFGVLAFLHWDHDWNNRHFSEPLLEKAVRQLQELGVSFVRMDILWSDIYAGPDQYNFERYEKIISMIRAHDLQILALLHYNKVYADADGEAWNKPPDSFEEFARYVGATVGHFKGVIHHWEIWNEPNHPIYWSAAPDGLKGYAKLLRLSYQAAKLADPKCQILNGGLAHPIVPDVRHLYENGGKDIFDILSLHTFVDPLSKNPQADFDRLIVGTTEIMRDYGDAGKKIWITEMGCPGVPPEANPQKWFQGDSLSEDQQARWIETQYGFLQKHPTVEKMFWAFYRDTGNIFKDGTDYLGLVRFDLSPKPAFTQLQTLIKNYRAEK